MVAAWFTANNRDMSHVSIDECVGGTPFEDPFVQGRGFIRERRSEWPTRCEEGWLQNYSLRWFNGVERMGPTFQGGDLRQLRRWE